MTLFSHVNKMMRYKLNFGIENAYSFELRNALGAVMHMHYLVLARVLLQWGKGGHGPLTFVLF